MKVCPNCGGSMAVTAATQQEILYQCKQCCQRWYVWIYPPKQESSEA